MLKILEKVKNMNINFKYWNLFFVFISVLMIIT